MERFADTNLRSSMDSDFPPLFRCPISMELMEDPVTISTGVTYERKSIEKWLFTYNKRTCPATMQTVAVGENDFVMTPNLTLKRVILAWKINESSSSPATAIDQVQSLLATVESSPFKVSSLRKLRSMIEMRDEVKSEFIRLNGIGIVVNVVVQILIDCSDFSTLEACEEALGVLSQFPISNEDKLFDEMSKREELMKSVAIVLQRGSAEGRFYAVKILRNIAKNTNYNWGFVMEEQGIDLFKPLLELVSDEFPTKSSSCALDVMIEILASSKRSRVKAIEAGAVWILIELLPESSRSKCERMLQILQSLCECAEGRLALVEHGMGIAAVTKKILNVSNVATKIGVKILLWISSFHPKERVVEEMMACGAVKKLLMILHMAGGGVGGGGRSSTKEKVIKILKMHGSSWRRSPCFPCELKYYLKLVNDD
ncbi:E3 ubiquitin-protein ligase PUB23-like [Cucurbita pepo subsp. pepo]|uniref:E3 ubiquitin-protein ligase PUB23-like n=1 Tax=Cucurbita pepo subsp. pepo TaxID=3664 RepID=UPI000C9D86C2|nr:E3 ubiquitin-protein ligase PUB23-like [Cucurbita pepo subsp. pepo]